MRFVGDIAEDAEVRALASGAITDGEPVIVNSTGTVSGIITPSSQALGTAVVFNEADTTDGNSVFDPDTNKIIWAGRDEGNSNYGTAIVATIDPSDNSVSFGSKVVFNSAASSETDITYDTNSNKVVIAWANGTSNAQAIVGTVSGTSISFGSAETFNARTSKLAIAFDSNSNKVVIAYEDFSNSKHGTAIVGTVSSTSISFGSESVFESAETGEMDIAFDSNVNKMLIVYKDSDNSSHGTAIVGTVSGTSISYGSAAVFHAAATDSFNKGTVFDTNSNKFVITYNDSSSGSDVGTAKVATISGTSVSFGSASVVPTAKSPFNNSFDSTNNKIILSYKDTNSKGSTCIGTISGTSISFGSAVVFENSTTTTPKGNAYDSNSKRALFTFQDGANSGHGTGIVLSPAITTNITTENFIGFAHAAYADGQKATVKTTGSIARNIPQQPSASDSLGSATVFESGALADGSGQGSLVSTFDSSNNRVIVAYTDQGNSSYGTVCVGTVSGTTITFGTPTVIESAFLFNFGITFDSNVNKVVIVYTHQPTSETGKAIVGTIDSSDNSISFGTPATFNSSANNSNNKVVFDSNSNKVGIFYRDWGNSQYGTAKVGTISGTDITFGSATVFESGDTQYINCTFDSSNNKIVVAYQDNGNSNYGTAIVGTISGTSISFGSAVVFESATTREVNVTFDSSNNKVVVVYQDNGNSGDGTAIVGTVSGTGISFGSATVFETGDTSRTTAVIGIAFDSNLNKVIVSYYDDADSDYGKYAIGTVSGTSISFATAATFNAATTKYTSTTFDSNENKAVIFYRDDGDSSKGKAIVLAPTGTLEDLTIGQQYFVQTDGTLGTSADSPSVIAGTAIGASDIIVKG